MWQTLLAAVLAAILVKSLDWLPKLLPVAKSGASRLSGVLGQWWSGFVVGACVAACLSLAVGVKLPEIKWPDFPWPNWTDEEVTPTPARGFRVAIVRETGDKPTREQLQIFGSSKIAAYLNEKCVQVDGRAEWRKWDDDIDLTHETDTWKKFWDVAKPKITQLPAIVIANDRTLQVLPLPATEEATLELLRKHGG